MIMNWMASYNIIQINLNKRSAGCEDGAVCQPSGYSADPGGERYTEKGEIMDIRAFYLENLHVDDACLIDALVEISHPIYLNKGDLLVRQGDRQEDFLFLVNGIFRGYYLDVNGKEVTDCIGFKSGTPAMSSAIDNAISPISIEAVVESVFLRIDGAKLIPLIERSPLLLKIYNEVLQTAMQIHWALKVTVTQRTALERYQWFLENYPGLIDQVSNKHIASYLGMTPVTLSRMRRMMREREAVEKGVQET